MLNLHIITPVSRPQNLDKIAKTLLPIQPACWHCGVDPRRVERLPKLAFQPPFTVDLFMGQNPGEWGNGLRNEALDRIPADADAWIYFLDDDNGMHPQFRQIAEEALQRYPDARWLIFRQIFRDGRLYLPATVKPIPNASRRRHLRRSRRPMLAPFLPPVSLQIDAKRCNPRQAVLHPGAHLGPKTEHRGKHRKPRPWSRLRSKPPATGQDAYPCEAGAFRWRVGTVE